jgi:hypothetical protein
MKLPLGRLAKLLRPLTLRRSLVLDIQEVENFPICLLRVLIDLNPNPGYANFDLSLKA